MLATFLVMVYVCICETSCGGIVSLDAETTKGDFMKKTMLVCVPSRCNNHAGEYYDEILIDDIPEIPTMETFQDIANIIRGRIRKLWHSIPADDVSRKVVVTLDGHAPYSVILTDLQILMKSEEGIELELNGTIIPSERDIRDPETIDVITRMGGQFVKA